MRSDWPTLGFGLTKVLALPQMVDSFHRWQLPLWMMYFVGAAQLLGGVGFFIRNFRLPASFAMGLVMVGATVTVLATAHSRGSALLTLLLAMLCFFVAGYRLQQFARELMAKSPFRIPRDSVVTPIQNPGRRV